MLVTGWRKEDLRRLMSRLPAEELSVAGHAIALASWHEVRQDSSTSDVFWLGETGTGQADTGPETCQEAVA